MRYLAILLLFTGGLYLRTPSVTRGFKPLVTEQMIQGDFSQNLSNFVFLKKYFHIKSFIFNDLLFRKNMLSVFQTQNRIVYL